MPIIAPPMIWLRASIGLTIRPAATALTRRVTRTTPKFLVDLHLGEDRASGCCGPFLSSPLGFAVAFASIDCTPAARMISP